MAHRRAWRPAVGPGLVPGSPGCPRSDRNPVSVIQALQRLLRSFAVTRVAGISPSGARNAQTRARPRAKAHALGGDPRCAGSRVPVRIAPGPFWHEGRSCSGHAGRPRRSALGHGGVPSGYAMWNLSHRDPGPRWKTTVSWPPWTGRTVAARRNRFPPSRTISFIGPFTNKGCENGVAPFGSPHTGSGLVPVPCANIPMPPDYVCLAQALEQCNRRRLATIQPHHQLVCNRRVHRFHVLHLQAGDPEITTKLANCPASR